MDELTVFRKLFRNGVLGSQSGSMYPPRNGEPEPIQRVSVHCSSHSPRGILIHPMEDLWLGLLLASLLRPGSFCYSHCSFRHRLCLFRSALPLPLRAKNQRAIWKFPLVSTLLPIFLSLSSTAKSAVLSWLLSLAPTALNTPPSSRLKNSSTYLIPLKSPAPLSLSRSSTFNPSNKRSPMLTPSITRA